MNGGSTLRGPRGRDRSELGLDLIRLLCAIFLPPLGVFLQVGASKHFWLNLLLTLLGFIPGLVHAVWIIARRGPDAHLAR